MKKIALCISAILLILLGCIGAILPIVQGFPFIIAGLVILTIIFPELQAQVEKHTQKVPMIHKFYLKMRKIIHSKIV